MLRDMATAAIVWACMLGFCTVSAVFTSDQCGSTKNCMMFPTSCNPSSADCIFFSWIWNSATSKFEFELSGGAGNGDTYAAVAFGRENKMENADTYYCTGSTLVSAAITTFHEPPTTAANTGIDVTLQSTGNGVAQCTFTRVASVTKDTTSGTAAYDLTNEDFYIMLARGVVTGGAIQYHNSKTFSASLMNMTTSPAPVTAAPAADGCGTTRGCFQFPSGCSATDPSCVFFSWSWNANTELLDVELSGGSGGGGNYAAVAFGLTDKMQDADLYFCTGNALGTGSLTTRQAPPTQVDLSGVSGVTVTSAATNGGVAVCKFTRVASVTKATSSGNTDFDLTKQNFYLLVARGSVDGSGTIQYHDAREVSGNSVNLMENTGAGTRGVDIMFKAHGSLMVLAWLFFANVGALMARHFKPLYPDTQPGGKQLWFQVHRSLMATVFLATVIAFVLVFVKVDGFVSSGSQAHGIIGIVVMALALTNPILAFFRPHPKTPRRPIFNWTHYLVGTSARALGIANLFLGVSTAPVERALDNWTYILAGFCAYLVVIEITMEILSWHYCHITNTCGKKEDDPPAPSDGLQMSEQNVRVRGQGIKTFLLILYIIGLAGFSIAFFVAMGVA